MQFDGSDKHAELTVTDEGGAVLHRATKVYKDGTLYRRETSDDDPNVYGEWRDSRHGGLRTPNVAMPVASKQR